MKSFFQKYKHAWVLLYAFIYFPWFFYLEKTVTHNYKIIQVPFDLKIPFIEHFIIPYLLWFAFVAGTLVYFFFKDKHDFYRLSAFLIIGMTLFLVISTLWPNGQALRPKHFERDNIFIRLVQQLYLSDTPTNVFPSIHVYNSIACYIAIRNSKHLKEKRWVQIGAFTIAALIILSTMFLKQHSCVDVIGAGIFAVIVYAFVYAREPKKAHSFSRLSI